MKCLIFFDCLNERSVEESKSKLNDQRFGWLLDTFLPYLSPWKENINYRPEIFTQTEKGKMFLAWQTFEGIQITIFSLIEMVKYLLEQGMPFALSERFCQDSVEDLFYRRCMGRCSDNPDINQFDYNNNAIQIQRNVSHTSGNSRGRYDKKGYGKKLVMTK